MKVNSGYRPGHWNAIAKGAVKSKHITCEAVDIDDPNKELYDWLLSDPNRLKDLGLWIEHRDDSPTWTHLQIVAPESGLRVFRAKKEHRQLNS